MGLSKTQVASLAMYNIGGKAFNNIDTDSTQQAIVVRSYFDSARDEMLRSHSWNFATKRVVLNTVYNSFSGSTFSNNAGLFQINYNNHGLNTGDRIEIDDVSGISVNTNWYVTVIDVNNFTLQGSVYANGYTVGTGTFVKVPPYKWNYWFPIPSDAVRIISLENPEDNFAVESGYILADTATIMVKYVWQCTDTTIWPMDFTNAFAMLLSSYIAQTLNGDANTEINYRKTYEQMLKPLIKFTDSNEGRGKFVDYDQYSEVIMARKGAYFY